MSNSSNYNYEEIDRPYNNLLQRNDYSGDVVIGTMNASSYDSGENVGENYQSSTKQESQPPATQEKIGGQSFTDMWIETWIKSVDYMPKKSGFLIDGRRGYIECMRLYVGDEGIIGGKLDIPDETSANSFHVDANGNTWWGCNVADFNADNENAVAYILNDGTAKMSSIKITGLLPNSDVNGQYLTDSTVRNIKRTVSYGVNFMPNKYSDFEQFGNGESVGHNVNGTAVIDDTENYFGGQSVKVTATFDDQNFYLADSDTDYNITLYPSTKYVVSFYAKGNAGGEEISANIKQDDATLLAGSPITALLTTSWVRYSFIFTTDGSLTSSGLLIINNGNNGDILWVDGVQIELASDADTPEPSNYRMGALETLKVNNIITGNLFADINVTTGSLIAGTTLIDSTQLLVTDGVGNNVFKCYASGVDVGDVIIGNEIEKKYVKFDKSASKLEVFANLSPLREFEAGSQIEEDDACFIANGSTGVITSFTLSTNADSDQTFGRDPVYQKIAQSFQETVNKDVNTIDVYLGRQTGISDSFRISIQSDNAGVPSGTELAYYEAPASTITSYVILRTFVFNTSIRLVKNTKYWLVFERTGSLDGSNHLYYHTKRSNSSAYANGNMFVMNNGTWVDNYLGGNQDLYAVFKMTYTSGLVYPTSSLFAVSSDAFLGFSLDDYVKGDQASIQISDVRAGFTGLTPGSSYYLQDSYGDIGDSVGTVTKKIGRALSATDLQILYTI